MRSLASGAGDCAFRLLPVVLRERRVRGSVEHMIHEIAQCFDAERQDDAEKLLMVWNDQSRRFPIIFEGALQWVALLSQHQRARLKRQPCEHEIDAMLHWL